MRNDLNSESNYRKIWDETPLIELMDFASEIRNKFNHPERVTYVIDTNPNYTNVCTTDCIFCSFYREPDHSQAYVLEPDELVDKIERASKQGATTALLQGGHNPILGMDYVRSIVKAIQKQVPDMHLHLFSPSEIASFAEVDDVSTTSILEQLWELGLRTIPGGGAEILSERVRRKISPKKISAAKWLSIMREAHKIGFKTTATMMYGHIEKNSEIIEHLLSLKELQDETGGFYAFIPWSFKPGLSPLGRHKTIAELPSYYARLIAISRIILNNFPHIQASWFGEGWRAGQIALNSGADDFGGVLLEENVLFSADHKYASTTEAVRRIIHEAGFEPVQRTTLYEHLEHNELSSLSKSTFPRVEVRSHEV